MQSKTVKQLSNDLQSFVDQARQYYARISSSDAAAGLTLAAEAVSRSDAYAKGWLGRIGCWLVLPTGLASLMFLAGASSAYGLLTVKFGMVLSAVVVAVALAAELARREGQYAALGELGRRVKSLAEPLSSCEGLECRRALQLMNDSDAARALRDEVVARGEELLGLHLEAMELLCSFDMEADAERRRLADCKRLHGLPVGA